MTPRNRIVALAVLSALSTVPQAFADLVVGSQTPPTANSILRYDQTTGAPLGVFASGGEIDGPLGLTVGPDHNLYVASGDPRAPGQGEFGRILRYNGATGAFMDVFASGGGLNGPINSVFGPDGNLYISSSNSSQVLRYDGTTGAFIDVFASGGGLSYPRGLTFGSDGNLYVVSYSTSQVLRYDGTTGAFLGTFVQSGSGGLYTPSDLAFGPDGNLYVTGGTFPTPGVFRYDGTTGSFINQFAVIERGSPLDMAFGPDGNLYVVTGGASFGVVRFNGKTGAFIDNFVPDGSGGLSNPFGLAFLPPPPPPPPPAFGGMVTGMAPNYAVCHNFTTRQTVVVRTGGAAKWDCAAAGLVVNPGDRIGTGVEGRAK